MRMRWLVAAIVALVLAGAIAYFLRPAPVRRIAFLGMDTQMQATRIAAFRDELAKRGYVEGRNLHIDYAWAQGDFGRLPDLARDLVAKKPEVIVTAAPPPVRALQQATDSIPIVMIVQDPVGQGFTDSLNRPGRNITGVAFQDWELSTKRLDQLRRVVPGLTRIAILWNDNATRHQVEGAADAMGLAWKSFEVRTPSDIPAAVASAKDWGAQAMLQLASPIITKNRKLLIDSLAANHMPASCEMRLYVDDGCLMTYSADLDKMFRGMAAMTARILNGARPQDTPVDQPREFDFVINMKTARELGLTIPQLVLLETTDRVQ